MKSIQTDFLVIGAGPIGLACGIACKRQGLSVRIIDKGTLVNSIYQYPLNMTFFSTSEKLEIGDVPFISHLPKPNRDEALEYYRRVAMHWKLDIGLYEPAMELRKEGRHFRVSTPVAEYISEAVIIATGFYDLPNLMGIPGEELPKVHHYYREAHPYFGQDIVVVGAANSAVDVALETWRKGARVTMVIREPAIQDNVKYWVKPDIENRIKDGDIRAYFNASLTAIRPREVDIQTADGSLTLFNDFVLAMTGYLPDFQFLQSAGILLGDDPMQTPVHNPETMETNVPGLYLAGVICGGLQTNKWFIENSRDHAERIVEHLLGGRE